MIRSLEGLYVQFSERLDPESNARIHALCDRLLNDLRIGITDLYPGYVNLYVEFDANLIARDQVRQWVNRHLNRLEPKPDGRQVVIPTRYDGQDLIWVAEQTGLSVPDVIRLHAAQSYRVYTVGFVPGQPMMGALDPALFLPRRSTPRSKVPANAVAIAVGQTCIYSLETPGGWHLLGAALEATYDPHRQNPFLLNAGDSVRFQPSDGPALPAARVLELLPETPSYPVLRVERPGLLDLVVDGGRWMASRFGMALCGPMDSRSARIANAVVGNRPEDPLLELTLKGPVLKVLEETVIGFAGFGMELLLDGAAQASGIGIKIAAGRELSFRPISSGVRAYLAVAGGLDHGAFLGSRSTDLRGLIGRTLRTDDVLGTAQPRRVRDGFSVRTAQLPRRAAIRLRPGPQATPEALAALCVGVFTVGSLDRMGVRLEGPKVPGGELISEATPMGAVQITTNGDPIILLNDRGRIGGYAKPAVIDPRDLPIVAQLRPGQQLRFLPPPTVTPRDWFVQLEPDA